MDSDTAPYTMADLAADPLAVLDGHGIAAAHLVGASMGGIVFPPAHAEALAAAIPGARLAEVPGMGHTFLSPGLPEQVADLILDHTAG